PSASLCVQSSPASSGSEANPCSVCPRLAAQPGALCRNRRPRPMFRWSFMSFASLGLSEAIVRAVSERGYSEPTPIQLPAIPAVLSGGDLLAGAQTGTGKTAGFVLPILQRLSTTQPVRPGPAGRRVIRTLILTPTRELAAQVEESVRDYSKHVKVSSTTIFGGVNINPQIDRLRRGVDILVA